jgi:hypothetical protein
VHAEIRCCRLDLEAFYDDVKNSLGDIDAKKGDKLPCIQVSAQLSVQVALSTPPMDLK